MKKIREKGGRSERRKMGRKERKKGKRKGRKALKENEESREERQEKGADVALNKVPKVAFSIRTIYLQFSMVLDVPCTSFFC